jgi:hypothetical protein
MIDEERNEVKEGETVAKASRYVVLDCGGRNPLGSEHERCA